MATVAEVKEETSALTNWALLLACLWIHSFPSIVSLFLYQRSYCPAPIRTLSEGYVETTTASPEMSTWSQTGQWSGTWTCSEKAGGSVTDRLMNRRSSTFFTQSTLTGRTTTRATALAVCTVSIDFDIGWKLCLIRNIRVNEHGDSFLTLY